jgi:drug/metabolite transporter (DMT)-like permease
MLGVLGLPAQLFLTKAYSYADASIITPIGYFEIIMLSFFDYFITKTIPDYYSIAGILVIVSMGTLIAKEN